MDMTLAKERKDTRLNFLFLNFIFLSLGVTLIYNVLSVSDGQKEGIYLHINFSFRKRIYIYTLISASVSIDVIEAC